MSVTERRKQLLRVLANFDQQMAEAESLAAELVEGGADWKYVVEWKEELSAARENTSRMLDSLH